MRKDKFRNEVSHSLGETQSRGDILKQLEHGVFHGGTTSSHRASGIPSSRTERTLGALFLGGGTDGVVPGLPGAAGSGQNQQTQTVQDLLQQITSANQVLNGLKTVQQSQVDTLTQNTQALIQNTVTKTTGGSGLGAIGKIAGSFLGGGFGLSSLINGLIGLFGGGGSSAPAPLVPFQMPASVQFQGGIDGGGSGGVVPADYGQNGVPRSAAQQSAPQQVTIQVNAMDSQSFMDHSEDIARAVRQAMLHSNRLNDVVADL